MNVLKRAVFAVALAATVGFAKPGQVVHFCKPEPNSTGLPGRIDFTGSTLAADGEVRFRVFNLPPNAFGMLAMSYGSTPGYPFGNGRLCLSPWDLHRATATFAASEAGEIEVDAVLPAPPAAGQWHYFQAIYRDTEGHGFDLTDAVGIEFIVL